MTPKELPPEREVLVNQPVATPELGFRPGNMSGPASGLGNQPRFDSSQGEDVYSDPKPQRRYRASNREWQEIRLKLRGEACWSCGGRWTELHHILNRSHSGDDVVSNLAPVCSQCHARIEARDPQVRSLIRQALMPTHLAYLRRKLGDNAEGWLSRHYPLGTFAYLALGSEGLDLGVEAVEVLS